MSDKIEILKDLRDKTGIGMSDCKKALEETNYDTKAAMEVLRKKGLISASKKLDRETAEGAIAIYINEKGDSGSIVQLSSETDFVANNDRFQNLIEQISKSAYEFKGDLNSEMESFKSSMVSEGKSINDLISENIAVVGENITLKKANKLSVPTNNGVIISYIHNTIKNNIGKLGVLVAFKLSKVSPEFKVVARQIAMHIAASNPEAITIDDLNKEIVEKERNLLKEEALASGKPANVVDKMVEGRINKLYEELVLMEQAFVIDNKMKIKDVIQDLSKEAGEPVSILGFIKLKVGEK